MEKLSLYQSEKEHLQKYLELVVSFHNRSHSGMKYYSVEEFVKENGKFMKKKLFRSNLYPKAFRDARQCYKNAYHLSCDYSNLTYVEGYVIALGIPLFHAWCIDEDGKVVDPTISHIPTTVYFGVPFKFEYVFETVTERGYYGVIDNMEQKFPLLRGEIDIKDVIQNGKEG